MELKEGMYVRTKYGVAKIIEFEERKDRDNIYIIDKDIVEEDDYLSCCIYDYNYYLRQVLKASNNIIDLIEVGDYVNGQLVYEYLEGSKIYLDGGDYGEILILEDGTPFRPIESIVTKEQFESMSYKVGE